MGVNRQADVQEPGSCLLPSDKLRQILSTSMESSLTLESDAEAAYITGQNAHFKVFAYPAERFPELPTFNGEPDFEIAAGQLNSLINRTLFATARETSRYAINGVLMDRQGKELAVVATDGRRLALARGACQEAGESSHSAIVPTRALSLLQKMLSNEDDTVQVRVAENQIFFAVDDALLVSNLVEGNFPPYQDVVPKDGDKRATLHTDELLNGVRRARVLTNDESKGVKFSFGDGGLTLSSRAPETGESTVQVDVPKYEGDGVEIGFNPEFLLDALKAIEQETVRIELKESGKPGLLTTGDDYLYVIMPVSL